MCFSQNLSLAAFCFGILGSVLLLHFGNKKSTSTNKTIAYFFIFVALMQLVEYFLWADINCSTGFNRLGAIIGPLLNHLQPIVLLILASLFLKSANIISSNILITINALYFCYIIYQYYKYITNTSNLCVKTNSQNHLNWTWKKDFYYAFYILVLLVNIINFYTNTDLVVALAISCIFLITSRLNFDKNIGELWCLMVTSVPLIILTLQKLI